MQVTAKRLGWDEELTPEEEFDYAPLEAEDVYLAGELQIIEVPASEHYKALTLYLVDGQEADPKSIQDLKGNAFCATGPGGGIDPTCGKEGGGGSTAKDLKPGDKYTGVGGKVYTVVSATVKGKMVDLVLETKYGSTIEVSKKANTALKDHKPAAGAAQPAAQPAAAPKGPPTAKDLKPGDKYTGAGGKEYTVVSATVKGKGVALVLKNKNGDTVEVTKKGDTELKNHKPASGSAPSAAAPPKQPTKATMYEELKPGDTYVNSQGKEKHVATVEMKAGQVHVTFHGEPGTAVLHATAPIPKGGGPGYSAPSPVSSKTSAASSVPDAVLPTSASEPLGAHVAEKVAARDIASATHDKHIKKELTTEQKHAITDYTGSGYHAVNKAMRECPPKFDCVQGYEKKQMDRIMSAVDSAPKFKEPILVGRGMSLHTPEKLSAFIGAISQAKDNGEAFQFPSITSTGVGFKFSGNVKFSIVAKSGLYVNSISAFKNKEYEVLVSPNAKFKVAALEKDPGGYYHVKLEEH